MLDRLRRKFILINMAMVTSLVLAVLITVGIFSWQQNQNSVYEAMDQALAEAVQGRGGSRFDFTGSLIDNLEAFENAARLFENAAGDAPEEEGHGPRLGKDSNLSTPVAVYQLTGTDSAVLVSRITTASLSDSVLSAALASVSSATSDKGLLVSEGLYYSRMEQRGTTYVAFADAASASNWQRLILPLAGTGIVTLLILFIASLLFSRWALRPVKESWEQQRQFIADASHELKTPLTVILANTSIMLKHSEESVGSQSQWIESTQREAQGMQELVNDMLALARTENEDVQKTFEHVNLSDLVEGSLLQFESVAFERSVMMDESVEESLFVMGGQSQLDRLITILLDNACKYALPNSTIDVSLKSDFASTLAALPHSASQGELPKGPCAVLTVANQGTPIDPQDLPHLFDRFYRSDKARTRTEGSYGLGLAIAAQTCKAHEGFIAVQSAPEGKTSFIVALPLANSPKQARA